MIKRIEVTEDLLKVIPIIYLQENVRGIDDKEIKIDSNHLYNVGMHLLEDLSMALGIYGHAIKGTEDDPEGRAFNDEDTERMLSLHKYVVENLYYIETLIHQYAANGGLQVGVYKAKDNELLWTRED
jgi:hypothetical protein